MRRGAIAPDQQVVFKGLSSNSSLHFQRGYWISGEALSEHAKTSVSPNDVNLQSVQPPKRNSLIFSVIAVVALIGSLLTILPLRLSKDVPPRPTHHDFAPPDLEESLAEALRFNNDSKNLAGTIASKMKSFPVEYNRPEKLSLGDSTAVQVVIKTNEHQQTASYFTGFEGEVRDATVRVARDVSAELTGPPDRLQITLRGDKMRTILSPDPITWIWDVKPLKPGKAQVTLEVTSYIKFEPTRIRPVPIRVLQDTWTVDASGIEWARYQIEQIEPIRTFIFTMVAAIVGVMAWFGFRGWGKRKDSFET